MYVSPPNCLKATRHTPNCPSTLAVELQPTKGRRSSERKAVSADSYGLDVQAGTPPRALRGPPASIYRSSSAMASLGRLPPGSSLCCALFLSSAVGLGGALSLFGDLSYYLNSSGSVSANGIAVRYQAIIIWICSLVGSPNVF